MCNCIETVNRESEKTHNVRVCSAMSSLADGGVLRRVLLATEKTDGKRGKATPVAATYCPFCGEKYEG